MASRTSEPADDDPGYDVVPPPTDRPTLAKPARAKPVAASPAPQVHAEVDDDDDDRSRKKKRRDENVSDEADDDRPRTKKRRDETAEDDDATELDDRPRKKKKRKKKRSAEDYDDTAHNMVSDWAPAVAMAVIGLLIGLFATVMMSLRPQSGIHPALASIIFVVGELISIPITIVCLIVIGMLFGIEYGTVTHTIRSLAGLGFLVHGLMVLMIWIGAPRWISSPILFFITLGLFMSLFRLDVWEAMVTVFGLNLIAFAFNLVMFMIILTALSSAANKIGPGGGGGGGGPGMTIDDGPDDIDPADWDPNDGPPPPVKSNPKRKGR